MTPACKRNCSGTVLPLCSGWIINGYFHFITSHFYNKLLKWVTDCKVVIWEHYMCNSMSCDSTAIDDQRDDCIKWRLARIVDRCNQTDKWFHTIQLHLHGFILMLLLSIPSTVILLFSSVSAVFCTSSDASLLLLLCNNKSS